MINNTPTQGWRASLKVHPAADAFPLLSKKELEELAGDIKRNGLKNPIVLWAPEDGAESQLIDGRNRLDALVMIGRDVVDEKGRLHEEIMWEPAIGGDPVKLAHSLNVYRRHLTPEQKRELIAAEIKADPSKSDRQIARVVKASPTFVGKVRAEKEATGDVSTVDTRTDTKGRKQPARKVKAKAKASPKQPAKTKSDAEHRTEGNGVDSEASADLMKAKLAALEADEPTPKPTPDRDDIGADSKAERQRLEALVEELTRENKRLRDENIQLASEIEAVRRENADLRSGGLGIPECLLRGPDNKLPATTAEVSP